MAATYPPEQHVLRDLRFETLKLAPDHAQVFAPVQEHTRNESGAMRLGALGTMIDTSGAVVAIAAAAPDWIATADLAFHRVGPVRTGPVVCVSRLVRAGATTIVIGVELVDGEDSEDPEEGRLCGRGLMTFSRIPASASAVKIDPFANIGVRSTSAQPDSRVDLPLFEKIGLRTIDAAAGAVEIDKHDYVRNSFGTINGGVICMVFEAAAEQLASAVTGAAFEAGDIQVHYLSQTRTGPARTSGRVLRHDGGHVVCELRLVDTGNDDQLLALATVTLLRG